MATEKHGKTPTMHGPAIYRICVRGRLDSNWSDRFCGMQITGIRGTDGQPETILVGLLAAQAELSGVLNALYEMHLPVLSAVCLSSDNNSINNLGGDVKLQNR